MIKKSAIKLVIDICHYTITTFIRYIHKLKINPQSYHEFFITSSAAIIATHIMIIKVKRREYTQYTQHIAIK